MSLNTLKFLYEELMISFLTLAAIASLTGDNEVIQFVTAMIGLCQNVIYLTICSGSLLTAVVTDDAVMLYGTFSLLACQRHYISTLT
jgi:hypothetical protein